MKPPSRAAAVGLLGQPPSGGCVLKLDGLHQNAVIAPPAAFGRLCVETGCLTRWKLLAKPAAFGRLCVETATVAKSAVSRASRLRAAVC